jgi:hypothetical protein
VSLELVDWSSQVTQNDESARELRGVLRDALREAIPDAANMNTMCDFAFPVRAIARSATRKRSGCLKSGTLGTPIVIGKGEGAA